MERKEQNEERKNEMLHQICDKSTYEAVDRLKMVNKPKCDAVKDKILKYFEDRRSVVDYETYKRLIDGMDNEASVSVQRRNNLYDLDDIEDLDDL